MKVKQFLSLAGFLALFLLFSCNKDVSKPVPEAGFTPSKTSVLIDEVIQFTNTSLNAVSYAWSFGDGTTSLLESPSKSYTAVGVYTVTLVATGEGGTNSATQQITVIAAPAAGFTSSKTSAIVGETITFTNTSTSATSYAWTFGDGTTSTSTSPTKSYTSTGVYTVTLVATGPGGTNTITHNITVIPATLIYFIDPSDALLQKMTFDGTLTTVKDITGMTGAGLAYDNVHSKIFMSDFDVTPEGKIWKMDMDGSNAAAIATGITDPYGIALDLTNGKVYWADDAGNISRANLDGTDPQIGLVNVAGGWMRAVALDVANNKMYYFEVYNENLWVADLDGTNPSILIPAIYGYAIFIDTVNHKIYYDNQYAGTGGGLQRANMDGTSIVDIDLTETKIYGIDIDYDLNKLYWSARATGEIYEANLDGTGKVILKTGLTSPRGLFLKK
jgi:PKD repeat protein